MAFGGAGVCRLDGVVCFVEGAFSGEKALIEITERKKNFFRGRALEILSPIPERITAVCPLAFSCLSKGLFCPGCSYQNLSYEKEIEFKDKQFSELLKKFAGMDSDKKLSPLYAEENLYYRNKIKLHRILHGQGGFGFVSNDNKTILEVPRCHLACAEVNEALLELKNRKLTFDEITLRYTKKNGTRMVSSKGYNTNQAKLITEKTLFGDFAVPESSFFQVNIYAHEIMLKEYHVLLKKISPDIVFDLYCGVGVFGIVAAQNGIKSYGIDIDRDAIKVAGINAEEHNVQNAIEFMSGDVSIFFRELLNKNKSLAKCVVLDPPRTGLEKRFLEMLCDLPVEDIIYISCSADTLCRDLKVLIASGYAIHSTRLIDMFPRTKHFESITHLKK